MERNESNTEDGQYREIDTGDFESQTNPDYVNDVEDEELNRLKEELKKERQQNEQRNDEQQSVNHTDEGSDTVKDNNNTIASIMWLSSLVGFFTFFGFFIPLVIWILKKNDSQVIDENGKEIMNVLLSYLVIYSFISVALMIVLIGFVLAPIVIILAFIFIIIGAVKAADGGVYRTPLTIRFFQ